jgi:DNA-binding CsgD family transcriptional regulator
MGDALPGKTFKDSGKSLTPREEEVLGLIGMGYPNEQIAEKLGISAGTVKNHMMSIYDKLGLHTRREVIAWVWQHGLVKA